LVCSGGEEGPAAAAVRALCFGHRFAMPWQEGLPLGYNIKRVFRREGFFLHMTFQAILLLDCLQKKAFLRKMEANFDINSGF
jgi:hypothetical protein